MQEPFVFLAASIADVAQVFQAHRCRLCAPVGSCAGRCLNSYGEVSPGARVGYIVLVSTMCKLSTLNLSYYSRRIEESRCSDNSPFAIRFCNQNLNVICWTQPFFSNTDRPLIDS